MKSILWAVCLLAPVRPAIDLSAQVNPYRDGTPGVSGYRSEVLAEVMIQEDKFLRLAEAVPADKYIWRPAPDVRSFAEVFLHVSAANYNIYKLVGTPPPAGVDVKGLEKSTTDKTLDWFGGKNTERGVLLFVVRHAAEHLGQSIAYARFIGVVPPWTEDAQKQQKSKPDTAPKAKQQ